MYLLLHITYGTIKGTDSDQIYHFNTDPDLALRQSDANLRPLVYRPI
jgi:hypothetical protein